MAKDFWLRATDTAGTSSQPGMRIEISNSVGWSIWTVSVTGEPAGCGYGNVESMMRLPVGACDCPSVGRKPKVEAK